MKDYDRIAGPLETAARMDAPDIPDDSTPSSAGALIAIAAAYCALALTVLVASAHVVGLL